MAKDQLVRGWSCFGLKVQIDFKCNGVQKGHKASGGSIGGLDH